MLALTSAFAATMLFGTQFLADLDLDGLADEWEAQGHGPIDPKVHDCKPGRSDFFLVVCIRPGMKREQVAGSLDRVKRFFAETPGQNADGSTGINMIVVWGNEFAEEDKNTPYPELYEKGMPKEWRGLAHGVLLEPGTGGGGQANRNDWAGISNNWMTIVHELGHQFGLGHEPPGSPGQSPLYTSLMNYDYSYGFNGQGDAIHLSSGKFAGVKLDESKLDEKLPFTEKELEFLTHGPYSFRLQKCDDSNTFIDWNRNGVFGENSVRADIDDGYGIGIRDQHRLGKAAGSPSITTHGETLYVVYPDLPESKDYVSYAEAGLSNKHPGQIVVRTYDGKKWADLTILATNATGDPNAIFARNLLFVAYHVADVINVAAHNSTAPHKRLASTRFARKGDSAPSLVATKDQLWLFFKSAAGGIKYRRIRTSDHMIQLGKEFTLDGLSTQTAVAVAYDSALDRIVLATTEPQNNMQGRMKIHILITGENEVTLESSRWTMGDTGHSRTLARPTVLYDPSRDRGVNGGYLIYHKGEVAGNTQAATWLSRTIADKALSDGWRTSLIGNEWLLTRSAPSAALYKDDIAYAIRWFGGEIDNELLVNLRASGVVSGLIADHDDVEFIRTKGLRQSLGR